MALDAGSGLKQVHKLTDSAVFSGVDFFGITALGFRLN
jgi:hypothetical protein